MSGSAGRPTVAFDGAILAAGPITGVGRSFITTLAAYAARGEARCVLLLPPGTPAPTTPGVEIAAGAFGRLARQRRLPALLRELGADLLHCPVAALVAGAPCPQIATVHDLPWMSALPRSEPGRGALARLAVRHAAQNAAAILVPTHATAHQLARYVGPRISANIVVAPHGVPEQTPAADDALAGPFLALGDARPRKNLARTLRAHERAMRVAPEIPALRLVGPDHGYVSEDEKRELLRTSRGLLHFSLLEGFGLPVAEAMAHGLPVACSDIPSLREVAGDAALFANPTHEEAMCRAILALHRDDGLRARLRRAGRVRAAELTPDASARAWRNAHRNAFATTTE